MLKKINKKRVLIFIAWSFGISWLTGLTIFLTGGLDHSPTCDLGGAHISLAYILLATAYMFGPAIANVATRIITQEGKQDLYLKPRFEQGKWKYFLIAWFLPGLLTILGAALFFLLFPIFFDSNLTLLGDQLRNASSSTAINPWFVVLLQIIQGMLISPLLNGIATFGEEFGWRGYLQPKLMPLGGRKAVLITGLIWGIWHWPVILMGYNYGTEYFGAPFLGPIAMVWFTLSLSVIFGWITIKTKSVWPAVIAHGAINGIAAIGLIIVKGNPDSLLGPTPVGLLGGIGLTLMALVLLILPNALISLKEEEEG